MPKGIKNKEVYQMYDGKMCMKHTIEIYTPLPMELGANLSLGQMNNTEHYKQVVKSINENIQEVLTDNLESDVAKVETVIIYGESLL